MSETPATARASRKVREGIVVSDKMEKTVIVKVLDLKPHALYKKVVRHASRFQAHDEHGCHVGDRVQIVETRPMSKLKHWRVIAVLEKAK